MWTILLTTWRQGGCLRLELRTKRFKSWIETRKAEHHHKSSAQEMDGTSSDQEPRQFPAKDTCPTSRRQNLHTEKHILQYIYIYMSSNIICRYMLHLQNIFDILRYITYIYHISNKFQQHQYVKDCPCVWPPSSCRSFSRCSWCCLSKGRNLRSEGYGEMTWLNWDLWGYQL